MANSDKNIVITPNKDSSSADPKIVFSGADSSTSAQDISITAYPLNSGTLSFDASKGQLLSIDNNFEGSIFSVNDISGIPNIEVLDNGVVRLSEYNGRVIVGTGIDNESSVLQVYGNIPSNNTLSGTMVVRGGIGVSGDIQAENIYSNGTLVNPEGGISAEEAIAFSVVFGG
jgi:hypothetical protein